MANEIFCTWNDGPVVDCWKVIFGRSQVDVYCRVLATEDQVREHCTELYSAAYGPVQSARRVAVPSYAAKAPAAVFPK